MRRAVFWILFVLTLLDVVITYWALKNYPDGFNEANRLITYLWQKFNLELALVVYFVVAVFVFRMGYVFWKYRLVRWFCVVLIPIKIGVLIHNLFVINQIMKILRDG